MTPGNLVNLSDTPRPLWLLCAGGGSHGRVSEHVFPPLPFCLDTMSSRLPLYSADSPTFMGFPVSRPSCWARLPGLPCVTSMASVFPTEPSPQPRIHFLRGLAFTSPWNGGGGLILLFSSIKKFKNSTYPTKKLLALTISVSVSFLTRTSTGCLGKEFWTQSYTADLSPCPSGLPPGVPHCS